MTDELRDVQAIRADLSDRYVAAHDEWVAIAGRDTGAGTLADHIAYRMSEPLLAALAEEEARAARAEGEQPSGYMSQREWEDWSNEVADLLPEHYDGDEAQESIILHAVADMAAALWLIVTPSSQPSKPCGMNGLRGPVRCQLATWATLSTALCRCR
jgi:hypothetical protein